MQRKTEVKKTFKVDVPAPVPHKETSKQKPKENPKAKSAWSAVMKQSTWAATICPFS